jgi:hypothetical protein
MIPAEGSSTVSGQTMRAGSPISATARRLCSRRSRAGFAEGCRWFGRHRSPEPDTDRACFEWSLVRDVAEDVARRHHVSPGAVRGYAVVLRLDGTWWAGFGSGATVCSVAAAQDPQTARDVLLEAFESGLTGQR